MSCSMNPRLAVFSLGILLPQALRAQEVYDVFFLSDTTGSMGVLIDSVQRASRDIFTDFQSRGDVRFGVAEYSDGNSEDFAVRFNLTDENGAALSGDRLEVGAAIDDWSPFGGGDIPEDNLAGLRLVAEEAPWREDSQRVILWFGDAPGSDPASDGTTLNEALSALNTNCVQVIALDLDGLDETGQASEVVGQVLDSCNVSGGVLEDASELSDNQLRGQIDDLLLGLFDELIARGDGSIPRVSAERLVGLSLARTVSSEVGGRLSQLRFGTFEGEDRWQVWGQTYAFREDFDAQLSSFGTISSPEFDLEVLGGSVGVDYQVSLGWTVGLAVGGARGEAQLVGFEDFDVTSTVVTPYFSYYGLGILGGVDLYFDGRYSFVHSDYEDLGRGLSHEVELNVGVNVRSGSFLHGPFVQLRTLDGEGGSGVDFSSLVTQVGYQVSNPVLVNGGAWIPQLSLAWEHEFEPDQGAIGGLSLGEVDRDLAVCRMGLRYVAEAGFETGLEYQGRFGDIAESHYVGVNVGFRF